MLLQFGNGISRVVDTPVQSVNQQMAGVDMYDGVEDDVIDAG